MKIFLVSAIQLPSSPGPPMINYVCVGQEQTPEKYQTRMPSLAYIIVQGMPLELQVKTLFYLDFRMFIVMVNYVF